MSERNLGSPLSDRASETVLLDASAFAPPRRRATDKVSDDRAALSRFEQDQLAREYADIERASAALRLGEPQLRPVKPEQPATRKPRPLWFLIGALWLLTATVTAGAVVAIATFAG